MSDMPLYTTRFPVRWGDMDVFGHVNNAVYFSYFEQARVECLQSLPGFAQVDDAESGPVLVSIEASFKKPVVHPATVVVQVFGGTPGRTSFPLSYTLSVEGDEETVYAESHSTIVWIDRATGRPAPLPDSLRAQLTD